MFKACRKLSCRSSGNSTLQLELAALSLLQAVTAHPVAAASRHHSAMQEKLSAIADALLKESWQQQDEAEEETARGREGARQGKWAHLGGVDNPKDNSRKQGTTK